MENEEHASYIGAEEVPDAIMVGGLIIGVISVGVLTLFLLFLSVH